VGIDDATARSWIGHALNDAHEHKLGTIESVFFDDASGAPAWVALSGGLLSRSKTFVPVDGARLTQGGDLVVPYLKDIVTSAPDVVAFDGHLTPEDLTALREHYQGRTTTTPADSTEPRRLDTPFRGSSNESTIGSGQIAPGEPDDVSAHGSGHSDDPSWRRDQES
jgi:hypothetical protein